MRFQDTESGRILNYWTGNQVKWTGNQVKIVPELCAGSLPPCLATPCRPSAAVAAATGFAPDFSEIPPVRSGSLHCANRYAC